MQRLLTLVFLLGLAIPAGISISGCTRNPAGNYCNGLGYGLKLTDVASIDLEPRTTGVSLAFGQTQQITAPKALTCKGTSASVASFTYGTSNNQLLDISPTGQMCGGTWNRRSGGGIPDYTTCNPPSPLPSTSGLPYAVALITATANAITSNTVSVYVHAPVTSVSLVLEKSSTDTTPITGCLSQTQTAQLDAVAYYNVGSTQTPLCAPTPNYVSGFTGLPTCSSSVGDLTYTASTASVSTIDQNGVITAVLPGTTYITASLAGSGSSAGFFSTCSPKSISVSLNGSTTGTVTQGVTQNLVTTILDTNGNTIQGLTLDYQSTNPLDISAGSGGAITANFAGEATIYAVCQPTTCNPAPIDKVGVNQTGTPITSNSVTITTPGVASDYVWMASPMSPAYPGISLPGYAPSAGSQYFIPVQLIGGAVGSPVKMPYVPNSMVMDRTGTSLYFGSSTELMVYATSSNSLTKQDPNVPGMVLAAAPDNSTILINDPIRKVIYLYKPSAGTYTTQSGVVTSAQWTPDAKTVYVVGTDGSGAATLFVNNVNTGWTTYPLTYASSDLALTVPSVGAFLNGSTTVAHAWCPTLNSTTGYIAQAYPQMASVPEDTEILAATIDGAHILGTSMATGSPVLTDINLNLGQSLNNGACPSVTSGGLFTSTNITTSPVTAYPQTAIATPAGVTVSAIDQILPSPASNLAFITYSATTASTGTANLPYYQPLTSGTQTGPVSYVTLTGAPTAPIAGAFSLDDTLFFVSTSGDNLVHYIDLTKTPFSDSQQINPGLVDANGNAVPATVIVVKPRATT
jgi:trimeric autotransporter adhesin